MNPDSLKAARRRVLPWLTGAHGRAYDGREMAGCKDGLLAPSSHNLLCNLESKPFFAIVPDNLRDVSYFGARQPLRRRFSLRGIHAHIQGRILAEAEAPLTLIDLGRRHPDIEQHPVKTIHPRRRH